MNITIKLTKKQVYAIRRYIAQGQDEPQTIKSVTEKDVVKEIEDLIYYEIETYDGQYNPANY